jgi:hypothetical protein
MAFQMHGTAAQSLNGSKRAELLGIERHVAQAFAIVPLQAWRWMPPWLTVRTGRQGGQRSA